MSDSCDVDYDFRRNLSNDINTFNTSSLNFAFEEFGEISHRIKISYGMVIALYAAVTIPIAMADGMAASVQARAVNK